VSVGGLWLGLSPLAAALLDPYIKAFNAMPRVVLGPIFIVWFGLGITSKVVLGVTLVFFRGVLQCVPGGVREVSPVVLANARMLGASQSTVVANGLYSLGHELGVLEPAHVGSGWPLLAR